MAPRNVHFLIPETCECYLPRDFVDMMKLKIYKMGRFSWIIWVGLM